MQRRHYDQIEIDSEREYQRAREKQSKENNYKEIFEKKLDNFREHFEKLIQQGQEANELNLLKGYNNTLYKVPAFIRYTWTNIVVFTGIAFVLSTVIAVLFYFIWVDDKTTSKKKK